MRFKAIDREELMKIVYIDFEKSFDKVLLAKLTETVRISGRMFVWFIDFFDQRTKRVLLNDALFLNRIFFQMYLRVSGLLLFSLFIDDLLLVFITVTSFCSLMIVKNYNSFPKSDLNSTSHQSNLDSISDF